MDGISIRLATADDQPALLQLADLDSREPVFRPALVAEINGQLVVAISLRGGEPIADPFRPTAGIARLLELRRRQLTEATPLIERTGPLARVARIIGRRLGHSDA
jgi:hypothetical protein